MIIKSNMKFHLLLSSYSSIKLLNFLLDALEPHFSNFISNLHLIHKSTKQYIT